jgi:hypothetical protein
MIPFGKCFIPLSQWMIGPNSSLANSYMKLLNLSFLISTWGNEIHYSFQNVNTFIFGGTGV